MAEANLKIQAPWTIYYNRIHALFRFDNDIRDSFDEDNYTIKVYVDNGRKYDAIAKLLPTEKVFGNITVKTEVIPSNEEREETWTDLFKDAFTGNPIFSYAEHHENNLGTFDYVVWNPIVAQYYSDNMFDINGITSELYQDLAKEVFEGWEDGNLHFCTDHEIC